MNTIIEDSDDCLISEADDSIKTIHESISTNAVETPVTTDARELSQPTDTQSTIEDSQDTINLSNRQDLLVQRINALNLQKSALELQKAELERDLDKKTRLHENAMILVRDIQKEHTNNIEVLMLRIKSLEGQIETYKGEARDLTQLQEELDVKTSECKELEAACLELERELAQVTDRANRGLEDSAEKQTTIRNYYEEKISIERQRFQEEIRMLEEQLQADHRVHASSHLIRAALEESIADLSSISKELTLLSRVAHLQQAAIDFMELHVDRVGQARLREVSRQSRIIERSGGGVSFPAVHTKVDGCIQKLCQVQSELSSAGKSCLSTLLSDRASAVEAPKDTGERLRLAPGQAAASRHEFSRSVADRLSALAANPAGPASAPAARVDIKKAATVSAPSAALQRWTVSSRGRTATGQEVPRARTRSQSATRAPSTTTSLSRAELQYVRRITAACGGSGIGAPPGPGHGSDPEIAGHEACAVEQATRDAWSPPGNPPPHLAAPGEGHDCLPNPRPRPSLLHREGGAPRSVHSPAVSPGLGAESGRRKSAPIPESALRQPAAAQRSPPAITTSEARSCSASPWAASVRPGSRATTPGRRAAPGWLE